MAEAATSGTETEAEQAVDTTIKKVSSRHSPVGEMGQTYLVTGKKVSMRYWELEAGRGDQIHQRAYETVGYVIEGRARLYVGLDDEQRVLLEPGDSWLVPAGSPHRYEVLERFVAVEATAPPAHIHDRDDAATKDGDEA